MATTTTLMFTCLPNGGASGQRRLSLFVSPRLEGMSASGLLQDWTLGNWPTRLKTVLTSGLIEIERVVVDVEIDVLLNHVRRHLLRVRPDEGGAPVGMVLRLANAEADLGVDFCRHLATQVASLSGMPAYLSRPHLEMIKGEPRRSVVLARLRAIREMEGQADYDAAMRLLGAMGVRWYVHAGERGPRFYPGRSRAAFSSGALAVYRTP